MDLIGKTLGQYHIVEASGHGGMASVFKARQPALERYVAVKVLLPQRAGTPEFRERFTREAKAIAQLNHPNILPVIDYGRADDLIYIVMKYVAGGTLAERLKRPIDLAMTTNLIGQIAAALDHAHHRGIIHRDVKPYAQHLCRADTRRASGDSRPVDLSGSDRASGRGGTLK